MMMMQRNKILIGAVIVALIAGAYLLMTRSSREVEETDFVQEAEFKQVAEDFGLKLKNVPLSGEDSVRVSAIEENYRDFVTPELLASWKENPNLAPGRLTSSPWPERIEVTGTQKISNDEYIVSGDIIEMTSVEIGSGKVSARMPITLTIKNINNKLLIAEISN